MIFVYLVAAIAALVVYALTFKLGATARVLIALLVFAIPAVSATIWIVVHGDQAPPDAVTVNPSGKKPSSTEKFSK